MQNEPVVAVHGMVATTHPEAVQIGVEILQSGGNAIDAAVAVNAALGVLEPMSCGIGGDLFALVYSARDKRMYGLNASGRSPIDLNLQYFRSRKLDQIPQTGPLSWSIPGCVDGWDQLLNRFGTWSLGDLLIPSIEFAERGCPVPKTIATAWAGSVAKLKQYPDAATTFLPSGRAPGINEVFSNPRLAQTYRQIGAGGRNAFYLGSIAGSIVDFSRQVGGRLRIEDFIQHTSNWVDPVSTDYRGNRVWQIPPPGQGISVLQMLNLLEGYDIKRMGPESAEWWHLFIEVKKLVYADRARYYADPQFAQVPTDKLISKEYATRRRKLIRAEKALTGIEAGDPRLGHSDTVYITVVDQYRNCVSLIQSIYHGFGSGMVPGDLGFALQNRGHLFSLDESHPNCLLPRKRPFHTIIPAMVTRDDQPYFVFGVMGGDMQPQGQVQVLVNMLDFGMNIQAAGAAPRLEHTGSATPTGVPASGVGKISAERGISKGVIDQLRLRGHHVEYGGVNGGGYEGILLDRHAGCLRGAYETRRDAIAMGY